MRLTAQKEKTVWWTGVNVLISNIINLRNEASLTVSCEHNQLHEIKNFFNIKDNIESCIYNRINK